MATTAIYSSYMIVTARAIARCRRGSRISPRSSSRHVWIERSWRKLFRCDYTVFIRGRELISIGQAHQLRLRHRARLARRTSSTLQRIPELRILLVRRVVFVSMLKALRHTSSITLLVLPGAHEAVHDREHNAHCGSHDLVNARIRSVALKHL